jgi:hypothetical protein
MPRFAPFVATLPFVMLVAACPAGTPTDPAPGLRIASPVEGTEYSTGDPILLEVEVSDDVDPAATLSVRWSLDIGFSLNGTPNRRGVARGELPNLGEGTYELLTEVEDSDGNVTSDRRDVVILQRNTDPVCEITSPAPGGLVAAQQPNLFEGTASDADDSSESLIVTMEVGGVNQSEGPVSSDGAWELEVDGLEVGSVRVTAMVRDLDGGVCRADVQVSVSSAPVVTILSPLPGAFVNGGEDLDLHGITTDYQDPEFSLVAEWTSDVDGLLGTSIPTSVGAVSLLGVDLTTGTHTLTLRVTDLDGLVGGASVNVSVNAAPSRPEIRLLPAEPESDDILTVVVDTPSVDPEGGPVTHSWSWTREGVPMPFFDDLSVSSTQTTRGEEWTVEVYGVDSQGARSLPAVDSVTIANGLPVTTPPSIWPATAQTDTVLYCTEGTTTDPEGDPATVSFTWEADGVYLGSGEALGAFGASKGQTVVCIATPDDGLSTGIPVPSPGVLIDNAPPGPPTPVITPGAPLSDDTLVCAIGTGSTDADGDSVSYTYEWLTEGVSSGITGPTVLAASTTEAEGWACEVTPSDGTNLGTPGTIAVTIGAGTPQELDVGTETSVYSGPNTRGYWFQAPVSMTLTGLRVPVTLTGAQNVEVVRFSGGAPPEYPASAEDFTSLHVSTGVAGGDFIATSIGVVVGDYIGILGARGTATLEASYGAASYATAFDGNAVALTRLVYQDNLNATGGAVAVSSESTGAIGRIELEYSVP